MVGTGGVQAGISYKRSRVMSDSRRTPVRDSQLTVSCGGCGALESPKAETKADKTGHARTRRAITSGKAERRPGSNRENRCSIQWGSPRRPGTGASTTEGRMLTYRLTTDPAT